MVNRDGTVSSIRTVTVVCLVRRKEGKHPYTRRFLPPYTIPRSPLSCESLIALMRESGLEARPALGPACEALGCLDPRTARKHIGYVLASAREKSVDIARLLSGLHSHLPTPSPVTNPLVRLEILWNIFLGTLTGLFGSTASSLAAVLLWTAHAFCAGKISTAHVFFRPRPRDTS